MFGAFAANYGLKNIERRHIPITMIAFSQLRAGEEIEVLFYLGILRSLPNNSTFTSTSS